MADGLPVLTVADSAAWSHWLTEHGRQAEGVWLVLAKKGTTKPTRLTYEQALEEALCHGWVDGQLSAGEAGTFRRKFTPRRPRSSWSQRNVTLVNRLMNAGRMQPAGLAAVDRAKRDGSWDTPYASQAAIEVPADLHEALAESPEAAAMFARLSGANRYAILYRLATARRAETRLRRVEQFVAMLARGETVHPQ
jgi:uncharacterized protein YdeI (YjbR/CyaY-like superfamily)